MAYDMNREFEPVRPVVDRLVERYDPEEIWLFGSRAEGRARPDSDWDLLVVLPDDVPPARLDLLKAWEAVMDLRIPVDVIPCTRTDFDTERDEVDSLPRAAFLRGRRLYARTAQGRRIPVDGR